MSESGSEALTQAEHQADRVRAELFKTLEELDRRRAALTDWRTQAKANRPALMVAGGIVGALLLFKVGYALVERRRWGSHKKHLRYQALRRAWDRPQAVARPSERPFPSQLLVTVVQTAALTAATTLMRKLVMTTLNTGGEKAVALPHLPARKTRVHIHGPG